MGVVKMRILIIIVSDGEKGKMGLRLARGSIRHKRYDDVKVFFFGPSEKMITELNGEDKELFEEVLNYGAIDGACIGYAKKLGIEEELRKMKIDLLHANERIAHYIYNGYVPLTF